MNEIKNETHADRGSQQKSSGNVNVAGGHGGQVFGSITILVVLIGLIAAAIWLAGQYDLLPWQN